MSGTKKYIMYIAQYYIPVRHDMMRQTNDCSSVWAMQHKVMYFLNLTQKILVKIKVKPLVCVRVEPDPWAELLRPSGWMDLELCPRVPVQPCPKPRALIHKPISVYV